MMFWEPAGSYPCHSSQVHYRRWINVELTLLPLINGGNGDNSTNTEAWLVLSQPWWLLAAITGKGGSQLNSGGGGSRWSHIHLSTVSVSCVKGRGGRGGKRVAARTLSTCPHDFPILCPPHTTCKIEVFKTQTHRTACLIPTPTAQPATCHLLLLALSIASFLCAVNRPPSQRLQTDSCFSCLRLSACRLLDSRHAAREGRSPHRRWRKQVWATQQLPRALFPPREPASPLQSKSHDFKSHSKE